MFRWLKAGEGSYHDRVLAAFRDRRDEVAGRSSNRRLRLAALLIEVHDDLARRTGSISGFAHLPRDEQKELIVRLVNHEAAAAEAGDPEEAAAAELMSYYLAALAARDAAALAEIAAGLHDLTRLVDGAFSLPTAVS